MGDEVDESFDQWTDFVFLAFSLSKIMESAMLSKCTKHRRNCEVSMPVDFFTWDLWVGKTKLTVINLRDLREKLVVHPFDEFHRFSESTGDQLSEGTAKFYTFGNFLPDGMN